MRPGKIWGHMGHSKKPPQLVSIAPVAFRLPKIGQQDPYFGGTRTFWNELILASQRNGFNPPVRSFVKRKHPRAKTGIRFIDFQSALAWFETLKQEPGSGQAA